jgi:hypothetical protein
MKINELNFTYKSWNIKIIALIYIFYEVFHI